MSCLTTSKYSHHEPLPSEKLTQVSCVVQSARDLIELRMLQLEEAFGPGRGAGAGLAGNSTIGRGGGVEEEKGGRGWKAEGLRKRRREGKGEPTREGGREARWGDEEGERGERAGRRGETRREGRREPSRERGALERGRRETGRESSGRRDERWGREDTASVAWHQERGVVKLEGEGRRHGENERRRYKEVEEAKDEAARGGKIHVEYDRGRYGETRHSEGRWRSRGDQLGHWGHEREGGGRGLDQGGNQSGGGRWGMERQQEERGWSGRWGDSVEEPGERRQAGSGKKFGREDEWWSDD
jgi:hypothetical protein